MTNKTPAEFTLIIFPEPTTLTVRISGELDYDTSEDFVHVVVRHLAEHPRPHDVHLDFHELTWIDSTGLSALLMIHRHTRAADATLHLDNRPPVLDRILLVTNVLDHLTTPHHTRAHPSGRPANDDITGTGSF
ncbi:STAS domain-containing protein [Streptomyces sp. J2-1]|uniref:STAS domain-containing protein n=1 Tax=Streptomyces corallincola TaxID=2851888 RepID=UPI001C3951B8|nr:STAS domain-containing protein [Streptomyces corallincola]MBV2354006.1 STAS domain-containing protein [Streptomyces corallincola]